MPTKKRTMKKKSVKAKKKTIKKAKSKPVRRSANLRGGKATKARKKTVKKAAKKVMAKHLGRVVHYYDRIGVAIIELNRPLLVGEAVTFKRGDMEHTQRVDSLQIDHAQVAKAKKGDVVGVKVTQEIPDGATVNPA
jgi:methyl coenzyme M reductase alpha subunit